jgi:uncharacterized membrane protein YesL
MSLLDTDGVIYFYAARFSSLCKVSLAWFVVSLPVLTIGPATLALYGCWTNEQVEEPGIRDFLSAFRRLLAPGWLVSLILTVLVLIVVAMSWLGAAIAPGPRDMALGMAIVVVSIACAVLVHMGPVAATTRLGCREIALLSFLAAARNMRLTVGLLLIPLASLVIVATAPNEIALIVIGVVVSGGPRLAMVIWVSYVKEPFRSVTNHADPNHVRVRTFSR